MFLKNSCKKNSAGVTVIELLIVIFILTSVGLAIFAFEADIFSLNAVLSGGLSSQNEARQALKKMSAEIRSASISSTGSYPLAETDPASFSFYSDIDDDGLKERIRYFTDGATLKKGILKPSGSPLSYNPANEQIQEIVHDLNNQSLPVFSYYDTNYDGATLPLTAPINISTIRLVKITIIIDKNLTRAPGPLTLTTQISIRNLKDNL